MNNEQKTFNEQLAEKMEAQAEKTIAAMKPTKTEKPAKEKASKSKRSTLTPAERKQHRKEYMREYMKKQKETKKAEVIETTAENSKLNASEVQAIKEASAKLFQNFPVTNPPYKSEASKPLDLDDFCSKEAHLEDSLRYYKRECYRKDEQIRDLQSRIAFLETKITAFLIKA